MIIPDRATVVTDASYCQHKNVGGWAAWVRVDSVPVAIKGWGTLLDQYLKSSSYAEMYAALNGAWIAKQAGATEVLIRTDCMAVVHLVEGQSRSIELHSAWQSGLAKADLLDMPLRAIHVKAHTDTSTKAGWVNDWCDDKAKLSLRKARKGKVVREVVRGLD